MSPTTPPLDQLEDEGVSSSATWTSTRTVRAATSPDLQRIRQRRRAHAAPEHAVEDLTGPSTDGLGLIASAIANFSLAGGGVLV